jgi:two-component system nitrate/nitrite sensor histidine kinase NarX
VVALLALAAFLTRSLRWPEPYQILNQIGFYGLLCLSLGTLIYGIYRERESLKGQVHAAEGRILEIQDRMAAVFRLSNRFVQAQDENEIVQLVLQMSLEIVGAQGVSFVPLDEHGHPMRAIGLGRIPADMLEDWAEHLATPHVRHVCSSCQTHGSDVNHPCPLLPGPFSKTYKVSCVPIKRGERDLGMLNLYLSKDHQLDEETKGFLKAMVDEMAMAVEALRLRERELQTLRQMQALRGSDHSALLPTVWDSVQHALEADFAALEIDARERDHSVQALETGQILLEDRPRLKEMMVSLRGQSGIVVYPGADEPSPSNGASLSIVGVPLIAPDGGCIGGLVVGSRSVTTFNPRQVTMVESIAHQVAMLAQYTLLVGELEYQVMMAERSRLAREIHDGLAQTLGYLKLMSARMRNDLEMGDFDRVGNTVEICHQALAEAYEDVREAIDGLRLSPEGGIDSWICQMGEEFEARTGLPVHLRVDMDSPIPAEVQAQLVRILQEALNNVRKHAQASQVWISCRLWGENLALEVRDDGKGFEPQDVMASSQHGLRGMRERAELIGADFQIQSCSETGTKVQVILSTRLKGVVA